MDGDFWELDASTPRTLDGAARAVPGRKGALPLGLSRGTKLSRPKQIDFMQRFMAAPFLPSYSNQLGLTLQRVFTIPVTDNWFAVLLGQFNLRKFLSSFNGEGRSGRDLKSVGRLLLDKSLYALGFSSELLLTPDDTLLLSSDSYYSHDIPPRKKAVFHHKFPHHNLTLDVAWPALFVDKETGNYWDVPFSMALDLASLPCDSGPSYHLLLHHNHGSPKLFEEDDRMAQVPASLLPGTSFKGAFSYKKRVDIWRSKAQKLKMIQPYDLFLSDPHVSASGIIGAALTASFGENSVRLCKDTEEIKWFSFHNPTLKSALLGDIYASLSFTAQHGKFQRLFSDLTRFNVHLDFPSGSKFLSGTIQLAQDYLNSRQPSSAAVKFMCPNTTLSFQQQIAGPFSFRLDSGVVIDFKNRGWHIHASEPVFAIEYALQVLGSAKAVAWYSPKHQEFMVELRFFET